MSNSPRRRVSDIKYCNVSGEFYDHYDNDLHKNSGDGIKGDNINDGGNGCDDSITSIDDQLDFSQLVAREEELQTLHEAFTHSICSVGGCSSSKSTPSPTSHICLLEGLSGTGKSTLFHQFAKEFIVSSSPGDDHNPRRRTKAIHTDDIGQSNVAVIPPHILSGKCEEYNHCDPLSAIANAFNTGLKKILDDERKEEFIEQMRTKLNSNGNLFENQFVSIIPALNRFITDKYDGKNDTGMPFASSDFIISSKIDNSSDMPSSSAPSSRPNINENSWNRMKYMFKTLVLSMISKDKNRRRPIILFVDDLQWSDPMSIELLETLITDKDLKHYFFFVGAFRSFEEGSERSTTGKEYQEDDKDKQASNFVLQGWVDRLEKLEDISIHRIILENLSLPKLADFLKGALWKGDEIEEEDEVRVQELAAALHPKTLGNFFFTQQVLQELYTSGNITFCRISFQWEWDLDQIRFADNVLDAVTDRIHNNTSKLLQRLLTVAAYMRSTFDVDSIKAMIDLEGIYMLSRDEIVSELDRAVAAGFLVKNKESSWSSTRHLSPSPSFGRYSFAHDRIQQAAHNLIPEGDERDRFRFSVGSRLYAISRNKKLCRGGLNNKNWMMYSAADHFNATLSSPLCRNPLFLTIVNVQAGRKCMSVAAFKNASGYFAFGLRSLKQIENVWEENYELSLDLYECYIEAELLQGHLDFGKEMTSTLVENARDNKDTLRTQLALARALGREKSHQVSFELSRDALRSIDMYPSTSLRLNTELICDLLYVRRYFRNHSDEEILQLPQSKDKYLDTAIELYHSAIFHAHCSGNLKGFLTVSLKSIRATFKSGISPHSGVAFMSYSLFCDKMGDTVAAHRYAGLGLQVLSRSNDKAPLCLQLLTKTVYLDSWSTNTRQILNQYDEAYKSGIETGDFEMALRCRNNKLEHQYATGHSLALMDIQYSNLVEQAEIQNLHTLKLVSNQMWLTTRVLRGNADYHPLDFGKLFDFENEIQKDTEAAHLPLYAFRNRLQVAVYFGNYKFAARLIEKDETMHDKSHHQAGIRLFFLSLAHGTLYRDTGRRRHKKHSKEAYAQLKSLCQAKGMNSWHRYVIASAHLSACEVSRQKQRSKRAKKIQSALKKYDNGRELALRRNLKQDAGLAAQLAAEFLLYADKVRSTDIENYLNIARGCYQAWGATALVAHLEQKYKTTSSRTSVAETTSTSYTEKSNQCC